MNNAFTNMFSQEESQTSNASGLKPLGVAVLLEPYEVKETTKGGIIIPELSRKTQSMAEQRATVVEIGPCAWSDEPAPRAKPGDKVLFSKFAGYVAIGTVDGKEYRLVNDRDIFCQIEKESPHGQ